MSPREIDDVKKIYILDYTFISHVISMTCQNCKNISILWKILTILAPCNSHVTNFNIENKF